jgi:phosphate-selective porin OprO/OprP
LPAAAVTAEIAMRPAAVPWISRTAVVAWALLTAGVAAAQESPAPTIPTTSAPGLPRIPAARPAPGQGFPGLDLFEGVIAPPPAVGEKKPGQDEKTPEQPPAKKAAPSADPKRKPPTDPFLGIGRNLNVSWDGGGFRFRSPDGSFNLHLGGRLMTDEVWWTQSPNLRLPATVPANSPLPLQTGVGQGVGNLQDGAFLRRARFIADGSIFKNIDFKVEFDFENYNSIAFDESFVGVRNLPYVGMVRFGQTHVPFGLEAYTSSRYLPQLERSPLFDAFYQEFAPGLFTNTTWLDDRITMQHMFHRIDSFQQFNGASFGDGKYAYSGRVSGLPVYENDGRDLLHLGIAYQWRKGSAPLDFNGGTAISVPPGPTDLIRFRARPSLRDAVGLQGDNARVVDTGNIIADHIQSVNGELLWYRGPFWVQSELNFSRVNNALFPVSSAETPRGDLGFWGYYVQTGIFLTGENRGYDKPMGKYGRVVPRTNFFLVRADDGGIRSGPGAWELTYRYSYVDLNDKSIQGGLYSEHTVGLNWYWNANVKIQFNYINGARTVPAGAVSGTVQGVAVRGSLEF